MAAEPLLYNHIWLAKYHRSIRKLSIIKVTMKKGLVYIFSRKNALAFLFQAEMSFKALIFFLFLSCKNVFKLNLLPYLPFHSRMILKTTSSFGQLVCRLKFWSNTEAQISSINCLKSYCCSFLLYKTC